MKATATAPSNIAFIKFFGKMNEELRLPVNTSISMCLSDAFTTTTVEFSPDYLSDSIEMTDGILSRAEKERIVEHLDRIRKIAKNRLFAKVVTRNSFPKSSGIASSASGFAALTLAASSALNLNLNEKELSIIARLASGSASRSIPDGFVEWKKSNTSQESYAYSLYPPDYWDIYDIVVVVEKESKPVTTTDSHKLAAGSPFYKTRIIDMDNKVKTFKHALKRKDFHLTGEIIEGEALNMHAVMLTSHPPLLYWTEKTVSLMKEVWQWRKNGTEVYFTLDAGPNLHLICEEKTVKNILSNLGKSFGQCEIIVNKPANGARLI